MSADAGPDTDSRMHTTIYAAQGRAVIEQSAGAVVLSPEQILAVIGQLHACYDYCAAWKESVQMPVRSDAELKR